MRRVARLGALLTALAIATGGLVVPATAAASPVPTGFEPEAFDALSASDWWVTGTRACASGTCEALARTLNGGRSFTAIAPPPGSVAEVVFADADDGYAFGPGLWSTHDGGRTWVQLRLGTGVGSLVTGAGYAYALVSHGGAPSLMGSEVNRDRWTTLRKGGPLMWSLLDQGQTLMVQAGPRVLISHDYGQDFSAGGALPADSECEFQATGFATVIWGLCLPAGASSGGELIRTRDGGLSWSEVPGPAKRPISSFAGASADTVLVEQQKLERSSDAGASWSNVGGTSSPGGWTQLKFLSPTMGLAIGSFRTGGSGAAGINHRRLYETIDGGLTYHRLKL
jgi:photosystem II stability/assembly factor-like uncharacterized protein